MNTLMGSGIGVAYNFLLKIKSIPIR